MQGQALARFKALIECFSLVVCLRVIDNVVKYFGVGELDKVFL